LDGSENVPTLQRPFPGDKQLSKSSVAEDMTKELLTLIQDLVTMSHEEEGRASPCLGCSLVVEGSNDCLAGSGRGYNQVAPPSMALPFHAQGPRVALPHGSRLESL